MHRVSDDGKVSLAERKRLEEIARIKGMLIIAKTTLAEIDKKYGLPAGTAGNAVYEPHVAGERAIAAALDTRPHLLWFSRYMADVAGSAHSHRKTIATAAAPSWRSKPQHEAWNGSGLLL